MSESGPTAFVLSGGASLGAVQVGMLRALYEREITPDLIVATSAGAINGAFIAARPQTVETADELAETHSRLIADIELHEAAAKLVVLPPPCPLSIAPIDFSHSAALVERAARDARDFLDGGWSERPPIRMRMHRHDEYPRSDAREGGVQVRDLRLRSGSGDSEESRAPAA
jgi:predicted acylesterase/phospholipase RssA